jgi:hypothetical protein
MDKIKNTHAVKIEPKNETACKTVLDFSCAHTMLYRNSISKKGKTIPLQG